MSPDFKHYSDLAAGKRGLTWEEARLLRVGPVKLRCERCPVYGCQARSDFCSRGSEAVYAGLDEAEKRVHYARDVVTRSLEEHARHAELEGIERDAREGSQ
jgi:hypothetical protein